jgi:hypothetical protein
MSSTELLQDESEGYEPQRLSRWFASKPDARHVVRKHHTNEWAWHEAKAREYDNNQGDENDCNH